MLKGKEEAMDDFGEIGDTPFSVLMERAAKLKGAQLSALRVQYESWPRYYQNSLFPREEVVHARSLSFQHRFDKAQLMKEEGNTLVKEESNFVEATKAYESALAIFKYVLNHCKDWKNRVRTRC